MNYENVQFMSYSSLDAICLMIYKEWYIKYFAIKSDVKQLIYKEVEFFWNLDNFFKKSSDYIFKMSNFEVLRLDKFSS